MRIAVCCPGPSLPITWPGRAGFRSVIAVNRALVAIPDADWLSAGDVGAFDGLLPPTALPRFGVITGNAYIDDIRTRPAWRHLLFVGWNASEAIQLHEQRGRPVQWSVQAAICHAADLGATEVHLFGADMKPTISNTDCTGYIGINRHAERWEREIRDLEFTRSLLTARGVSVYRCLP